MIKQIDNDFEKFISGFVAGEGYFYVGTSTQKKRVNPAFGIKLSIKDKKILYKIKDYFGCGNIEIRKCMDRNYCRFSVFKIKLLLDVIIPFFDKNPMYYTQKQNSFEKWKLVINMIGNKEHLTEEGFELIRLLSKRINEGGKSNGNQNTKKEVI